VSRGKLYDWLVALRLEIEDVAEKDSEFLEQLAGMLKEMNLGVNATQTANVTGDNNKTAQAAGKNIKIQIG
jgi:hypothetical protein